MRLSLILGLIPSMAAAAPVEFAHQGRLLTAEGTPVDGTQAFEVRFYAASTGGSPLFTQAFTETLSDGYYSVVLSTDTSTSLPLDSALLSTPPLYVAVWIGGSQVGSRQKLLSTPYATEAGVARSVPVSATAGACVNGQIRWNGTLDVLQVCDGTVWTTTGATTAVGAHRYWRVFKQDGGAGGGYHNELQVFDTTGAAVTMTPGMLSQGGLISWVPGNLIDGMTISNGFHTDTSGVGAWMRIDFGAGNEKALSKIRFYMSGTAYANWTVQYSDDAANWTSVYGGFFVNGGVGWQSASW